MKCFKHPQADAVGICKHCCKGICAECVNDTAGGIVCSTQCQEEVQSIKNLLDRNKKSYGLMARVYSRNALLFALMGLAFIAFGMIQGKNVFLLSIGGLVLLTSVFTFVTARRYAKGG
jgi:hypothetical protein